MSTKHRSGQCGIACMYDIITDSSLFTMCDLKGNIIDASEAYLELTGYCREEVIGRNLRMFRHQSTPKAVMQDLLHTVVRQNRPWQGELQNVKKNSETLWIDALVKPVYDRRDRKLGYYAHLQDITDKKEFLYLSQHDPLTNAFNRRKGSELLTHYHLEHQRYNMPVSVAILDIDNFKTINDTYGHLCGDAVLQELSTLVRNIIRKTDHMVRWGGEEFLFVFPHTPLSSANIALEKIRAEIASCAFSAVPKVTASIGATQMQPDSSISDVIAEADRCLYMAKERGRNCVTVSEALLREMS